MTLILQAQRAAARLSPLLIEAERAAQAVRMGLHGRRRTGVGDDFWQFRPYQGGESVTTIDWKQSARGNKLYVREREHQAVQTVYLWADRSGSTQYRSQPNLPLKTERAHVLLLALTQLLLRGGERAVWLRQELLTVQSLAGFETLAQRLLPLTPEPQNLPPPLPLSRHAHMVIASDFLGDLDTWQQRLRSYAALNLRGVLLHVADPEEEDPSFRGRVQVTGCEGEAPLVLPHAESIHKAYAQRWIEHKASIRAIAQSAGWLYLPHLTNAPLAETLLKLSAFLTAER